MSFLVKIGRVIIGAFLVLLLLSGLAILTFIAWKYSDFVGREVAKLFKGFFHLWEHLL